MIDKDHIKGTSEQIEGSLKEKIGKISGDPKLELEGKAKKTAGKARKALDRAKDALRDN